MRVRVRASARIMITVNVTVKILIRITVMVMVMVRVRGEVRVCVGCSPHWRIPLSPTHPAFGCFVGACFEQQLHERELAVIGGED